VDFEEALVGKRPPAARGKWPLAARGSRTATNALQLTSH